MKEIELTIAVKRPILACGADLKGAFALAKGKRAYIFDGFGDLSGLDNFTAYEKAIRRAMKELGIKPAVVASDLHPNYFSSRFAEEQSSVVSRQSSVKVQHHEAHVASAIVDGRIKGDVIGVAFDGTGFGSDGNVWGGEFFVGNLKKMRRAAHLEYVPMPGGEACVKEPWRMAASYMYKALGKNFKSADRRWGVLKQMIDKKLNSPLTSSMGRLFDAAASIILEKKAAEFEAALPMELERLAGGPCGHSYGFDIRRVNGGLIISASNIVRAVAEDVSKGVGRAIVSAKFHNTVADIVVKTAFGIRKDFDVNKVVLTGGVFQNKFLSGCASRLLDRCGFDVYGHSALPVNDSGIPIGQIAIANARM